MSAGVGGCRPWAAVAVNEKHTACGGRLRRHAALPQPRPQPAPAATTRERRRRATQRAPARAPPPPPPPACGLVALLAVLLLNKAAMQRGKMLVCEQPNKAGASFEF
jgi:hypothetical protein